MGVPVKLAFDVDVTQRNAKQGLALVQAGSYQIRWTFKQGSVVKDLSEADTVSFIYAPPDESFSVTIVGSIEDAVNGVVLVEFEPGDLAVNSETLLYNWNLNVSGDGETLAFSHGDLDIPVNLASGSLPVLEGTVADYSNVASYISVANDGPYRAGDNIEFESNEEADGSQNINLATDITNVNSFSVITTVTGFDVDEIKLFFYEPTGQYAFQERFGNVGSVTTNIIFVSPAR